MDIDETLLCFGTAKQEARRSYMSAIRAGMAEDVEEDRHSWHPFRAPGDEDLEVKTTRPMIDFFGRSTDIERPHLNADVFVALVCEILDVEKEHVCSRTRDRATARVRRLIATLGVERWRQNRTNMATVLRKNPDVLSWWAGEGATLRAEDQDFAETLDQADQVLSRNALSLSSEERMGRTS